MTGAQANRPVPLWAIGLLGAGLALGQAPFDFYFIAFPALAAALWAFNSVQSTRHGFWTGWALGTGHFAIALSWIVEPFLVDIARHGWMAPFALVLMASGLALFWGAAGAISVRLGRGHKALGFVLMLMLAEYARATILTGFPWANPSLIWLETPLAQSAALTGPYGLLLLTLLAAWGLSRLHLLPVVFGLAILAGGLGHGQMRLGAEPPARAEPFTVRMVQPNAAQHLKWKPEMRQVFADRLMEATSADPVPDVIIWPETAIPNLLGDDPEVDQLISEQAGGARVIYGARRVSDDGGWFNSLGVVSRDGALVAQYDKSHLVPFGEYMPWTVLAERLGITALASQKGFSAGDGLTITRADDLPPFIAMICYEAIFPDEINAVEGRADWMIHITNDAWFGQWTGPYQHLAQARMRSIEQGLPLARSGNTGISAMIDPMGRVITALDLGSQGHIDVDLPAALPPTFYARFGNLPAGLLCLLVFAALLRVRFAKNGSA